MQIDSVKSNLAESFSTSFYIFSIWAFILVGRPQDYLGFLIPLRIALVFTLLSIGFTVWEGKRISVSMFRDTAVNKKFIILFIIMVIGVPFAVHRGFAFKFLYNFYSINVIFFYLFYLHVDSIEKLKSILFTMALAGLLYAVFTLLKGGAAVGRYSIGSMHDPNDLAYYIVGLMPLSLIFIEKGEEKFKRICAYLSLALCPLVVLLTGSRGGLFGLLAIVIIVFFKKIAGINKLHKIAFVVIATLFIAYNLHKIDVNRFMGLGEIEDDYNVTSETGRLEIWKTGLELVISHPITGVGAFNFARAFSYLRAKQGRLPAWKGAHNSYLQICAETGLFGFWVFISLIVLSLKSFYMTFKGAYGTGRDADLSKMSMIVLIGFVANLVSAFFLSQAYGYIFTLYFAIGSAINKIQAQERIA